MSDIHKYVLVDSDDQEQAEYDTYLEAEIAARKQGYAVVTYTYEFSDSELSWTPDGSDTWPPQADDNEKGDNE